MRIVFTILFLIALKIQANAQEKATYLVLFKDKAKSTFSVTRPEAFLSERAISRRKKQNIQITENDLPVNSSYISDISKTGAFVRFTTKWFNGVVVDATPTQLDAIQKLPFYSQTVYNLPIAYYPTNNQRENTITELSAQVNPAEYGAMFEQLSILGIPEFHAEGFKGSNMLIAVFDDGFTNANKVEFYKHLFEGNKILDTYNFNTLSKDVYTGGSHGFEVLSTIAVHLPGTLSGAAYEANFALYTTENNRFEAPVEEVTWLAAAERADSLGVDVINSSLGYNYFDAPFNTPTYNYTYEDMDGKTTIISRAARIASQKGMLVVNAAGNEGNRAWKYIAAPADVDSVLTVGSVTREFRYSSFSSIGPTPNGITKPDITAIGTSATVGITNGTLIGISGTSYAAPQIAGMVTILWQAYPTLTAQQIISAIKKSGTQYSNPDNYLGHGIPNIERAKKIIEKEFLILGIEEPKKKRIILAPNPIENDINLIFPRNYINKVANFTLNAPNGTLMFNKALKISELLTIPIPEIANGIYILNIDGSDFSQTIKIIK